ncbi:O-linked n-acetylglucosamine transferase, ogt [Heracleum sosnowskyi]|uniref:O-linked n-acetylglucosamine transferase, ogt n=1 Tax=Heracleum sosnowskyi TaxID=360622 RepID=A0AAD8I756_9APIA|nr:O-linked n-acetylglucosamine transferase, ogt [Heracleum sosnowskyi]
MLRTEPSFSIYNSEDGIGDQKDGENIVKNDGFLLPLGRSVPIGDNIGSGDFSFGKNGMGLIEEDEKEQDDENEGFYSGLENLKIDEIERPLSPPMYLATGFGMDGNGVGGGGGFGVDFKTSCFDQLEDVEEFYKRLVFEDPSNPLFLRNYAQLLQSKGDLSGAEDLYFRATVADPEDSEILLQYAKLVWELHHDQDKALSYFERAACAAPESSHVLAAYASFLWEVDREDFASTDAIQFKEKIPVGIPNLVHQETRISTTDIHLASGPDNHVAGGANYMEVPTGEGANIEDYYKMMVGANSSNPSFLKNYAQFLYQSKGDLKGADDYYSRAILADPRDGELISQYANLVWELSHDHDKASCYFERAVEAAPEDSHILAAYARFLWETNDED